MEFNSVFEDERWFTKCDETSINVCRDVQGAYMR